MAEEVAATATKKVGMATLRTFSSPSTNIVKVIPQGIIELSLRGAAIVLGFVALISAAASQGAVESINIIMLVGNSGITVPAGPTHAAGGWTIFLSFWVMLYQALAIVQLFLHIKLVYKPVPVINWSYFFLVDIIAIGIAAGGYFCSAVSMAAYAGRWTALDGMGNVNTGMVISSSGATAAFSFFALLLFIGMIVYFLLAKYVFLWPSHGDEAPAGGKKDSKAEDYAPEE